MIVIRQFGGRDWQLLAEIGRSLRRAVLLASLTFTGDCGGMMTEVVKVLATLGGQGADRGQFRRRRWSAALAMMGKGGSDAHLWGDLWCDRFHCLRWPCHELGGCVLSSNEGLRCLGGSWSFTRSMSGAPKDDDLAWLELSVYDVTEVLESTPSVDIDDDTVMAAMTDDTHIAQFIARQY